MSTNINSLKNKKTKKLVILALVVLGVIIAAYFLRHHQTGPKNAKSHAKTTSSVSSAQSDFTNGDNREPPTSNTTSDEGTVTDTAGNFTTTTPQAQWKTSENGRLIVYSPVSNQVLKNGDTLTGAINSLNTVSFRLIDSVTGVIAQGALNVKNNKFSGRFDFSTSAKNGRLDVFTTLPDGTEENNVEIPVTFK